MNLFIINSVLQPDNLAQFGIIKANGQILYLLSCVSVVYHRIACQDDMKLPTLASRGAAVKSTLSHFRLPGWTSVTGRVKAKSNFDGSFHQAVAPGNVKELLLDAPLIETLHQFCS